MTGNHRRHSLAARRRTRRLAGLAVAATVAGAATAGCGALGEALGTSVDRYDAACALLVDGSGSGGEAPDGFDAEAKLASSLPDFLADRECRTLAYAPITRASEGSLCQAEPLDLDPDADATLDRDELRAAQRAVASGRALELLECAREHSPGSDVIGALDRVSTAAPEDGEAFSVLVVSDFVQRDSSFELPHEDLTTPESRAALIDDLAERGRLPDGLSGATIYPSGYGMRLSRDSDAYADFDAFWTELLEGRVGADVDPTYQR
ncbi:hypothetical protein [Streptomyces triticirhizae]|uniref:VWA domain-containing protein n=1 Tax=Streptomyces triticirhizae TaxID=2483353 RepID=A0A3M2KU94_9ACTN|nr:hypothetical protein [Streptomyces triticirhizae]RMI29222.1 hypothetical protein EBN88_27660 [Streptomyces triticirhizae]